MKPLTSKNRYHGVSPSAGNFKCQIYRKGKVFYLGSCTFEQDAAQLADRAFKLTSAWSKRPDTLNFPDNPKLPHPDSLSPNEKAMMEWLRENYPAQEVIVNDEKDVQNRLNPVVHEFEVFEKQHASFSESFGELAARATEALRYAAKKEGIMEQTITNYKERILSLETQLAAMGCPVNREAFKPIDVAPIKFNAPKQVEVPIVPTKWDLRSPFEIAEEKRAKSAPIAPIAPPAPPAPPEVEVPSPQSPESEEAPESSDFARD